MIEIKVTCFNLQETLDCGQCFRWYKNEDSSFTGVIKDRVVNLKQEKDIIYIDSNKEENLEETIKEYLDLNVEYIDIEKEIYNIDTNIQKALQNTSGMRILNQDKFETVISYIISANNNIPRIKKSVDEISKKYGEKQIYKGKEYYTFPSVASLSKASKEDLRALGVGFRDKYIVSTVDKIKSKENFLEDLDKLSTDDLKKELITFSGVGSKVADCVILFAYNRKEAFPVDTWVKKVMQKLYYSCNEIDNKIILEDSKKRFGKYAGIIQQHLFQNIRKELI
ncbi:MAG: DNA glycosylase [Clostridia bacterium]